MKTIPRAAHIHDPSPRLRRPLLAWFRQNARDLPWRHHRTPYRVWVSEIMLQQTQVSTVIPYFERWMNLFPTVETLAQAPLPQVLKAWEGLGYYRRARFLHEGAKTVARDLGGKFPTTREGLLALPGIGPYASAAIASLAYGLPHAVVDGNVERVLLRLTADRRILGDRGLKNHLTQLADGFLDPRHPGPFNEAMMELGATVCTPTQPKCQGCPIAKGCLSFSKKLTHVIPTAAPRKTAIRVKNQVVLLLSQGHMILKKPEKMGRLQGLWSFPQTSSISQGPGSSPSALPEALVGALTPFAFHRKKLVPSTTIRHSIVNERHESHFFFFEAKTRFRAPSGYGWVSIPKIRDMALPIAHRKGFIKCLPSHS